MAFSLKTTYLRRIPRPPANKTIEFSRESTLGGCSPVQVNSEVPGQFPQPPQASKQNLQMLLVAQTTVTPCRMKSKQNGNEGTHHHPSIYHPVRETPGKNGWQGSPVHNVFQLSASHRRDRPRDAILKSGSCANKRSANFMQVVVLPAPATATILKHWQHERRAKCLWPVNNCVSKENPLKTIHNVPTFPSKNELEA